MQYAGQGPTQDEACARPRWEKMSAMIRGYWISQVVGTLAKLAIPDQLAAGPRSVDDLAGRIGCDPEATARLLRAASALGLVSKTQEDRFALTDLGELLTDIPGSLRNSAIALTAPGHWLPWGRLADAVRSGERQAPSVLCGELFHYYAEHPAEGRAFTGAMSASSSLIADEIACALDIRFARVVVDVGGASKSLSGHSSRGIPIWKGSCSNGLMLCPAPERPLQAAASHSDAP